MVSLSSQNRGVLSKRLLKRSRLISFNYWFDVIGWKNPNPPPNPPRPDAPTPSASPQDPCRSCGHTLNDHVKHLQSSVS